MYIGTRQTLWKTTQWVVAYHQVVFWKASSVNFSYKLNLIYSYRIIRSKRDYKKVFQVTLWNKIDVLSKFLEYTRIYYVSFHISYRHLLSYNFEAVHGFTFGVDAIKSILLMCAVVDKRITVEEAVRLSRLEVDFQVI